jgi:hypothetical protein
MKTDEKNLLLLCALGAKPADCDDIPPKRLDYILNKWSNKEWLEYGVSPRFGWLTSLGLQKADELARA